MEDCPTHPDKLEIRSIFSLRMNVEADQKVSVHLIITTYILPHYVAKFDCLAADRQGQGDIRLTLTPSVIPNCN
jgi:hypothetical protein